jgi:hypothetical protein
VPLKELLLSHYHEDAGEVGDLAIELRVRGVIPWVDKQRGGFSVGDESESEVRRVIREDCFGLVLYATASVFERPFIRNVEIPEALMARAADPNFVLFAVARGMGFGELQAISKRRFGVDLSAFHGVSIGAGSTPETVRGKLAETGRAVVDEVLVRAPPECRSRVSLQFSTRDLLPDEEDDVLRVDATSLFHGRVDVPATWDRLLAGLRDVKSAIAATCGRPRIYVHGSKHLTAAFVFGRVFAPFEMEIRQTREAIWRTDIPPSTILPLIATVLPGDPAQRRLVVEITSRIKDVSAGVDAWLAGRRISPTRLRLTPEHAPLDVDNETCVAMARQTYDEIERMMRGRTFSEIHLFAAAPQACMMMLGREFKGLPPVHLYEWTGTRYVRSAVVDGGVM